MKADPWPPFPPQPDRSARRYRISDERLQAFAKLTLYERLDCGCIWEGGAESAWDRAAQKNRTSGQALSRKFLPYRSQRLDSLTPASAHFSRFDSCSRLPDGRQKLI